MTGTTTLNFGEAMVGFFVIRFESSAHFGAPESKLHNIPARAKIWTISDSKELSSGPPFTCTSLWQLGSSHGENEGVSVY